MFCTGKNRASSRYWCGYYAVTLPLILFLIALPAAMVYAANNDSVQIVTAGRARAVITYANGQKTSAELLGEYIRKSSGAILQIKPESQAPADWPVRIHIGITRYVLGRNLGIEKLKEDGFVIDSTDKRNIVVAGPTYFGTEFGVCEFLERYVGVRWLLPGPDGEDVPSHSSINVPCEQIKQEPAFFSRLFSGICGSEQEMWARRNRMRGHIKFHHNLVNLFPPDRYRDTHPHFFPVKDGKRFLPKGVEIHGSGWQPCFTAEGLVEEGIKNICAYFKTHPEEMSYSLGVNDSSGYCQCEKCKDRYPSGKNFLGRTHVSDTYFDWCNKVIEGVLKKYPDKYFGCLAYSEVAQVPSSVKIHERMIPFMTYDRMKWIDGKFRTQGHEMTERWAKMCPTIGWYDYIYGNPYYLPRVYFHKMAEYYRFGHKHNVGAMYAEAYPNWAEGPKLYISLKLQWDPYQDVDELLRDWYVRAVGSASANELAEYYRFWEVFWTNRILRSKWFSHRGQYCNFSDRRYMDSLSVGELKHCRTLLESVLAKAKTNPQKTRARLFLRTFEFYEASVQAYLQEKKVLARPVVTEVDALITLKAGVKNLEMIKKRRYLSLVEFANHPFLCQAINLNHRHFPKLVGEAWGRSSMWKVFDWAADKDGGVRRRLEQLARSEKITGPQRIAGVREQAKFMLMVLDSTGKSIFQNSSFEEWMSNSEKSWRVEVDGSVGSIYRVGSMARTGNHSLLFDEVKYGKVSRDIMVSSGIYGVAAFVRCSAGAEGQARVRLEIDFRTAAGKKLNSSDQHPLVIVKPQAGEWTKMVMLGKVPKKIKSEMVKKIKLTITVEGLGPEERVYVDDAGVFSLE